MYHFVGCTMYIVQPHKYLMSNYPTCDVMYCRQRRHLYYGGEKQK
jgi:hypothetical protein